MRGYNVPLEEGMRMRESYRTVRQPPKILKRPVRPSWKRESLNGRGISLYRAIPANTQTE